MESFKRCLSVEMEVESDKGFFCMLGAPSRNTIGTNMDRGCVGLGLGVFITCLRLWIVESQRQSNQEYIVCPFAPYFNFDCCFPIVSTAPSLHSFQ